jgi:plasmid stabilization system protein ParE
MPGHEFEYLPEAIAEATQAFNWYAERSENAADRFWDELRAARRQVTDRPATWNPYLHGTRCYQLSNFPYGLVYIERGERIIGIAVAHLNRRPGYWRQRLKP